MSFISLNFKITKDNTDQYLVQVNKTTEQNVAKAAIFLQGEVKKTLNAAKSPPSSDPGDPPHRLKGLLLQSIQVETNGKTAKVGSRLPYASAHEFGNDKLPPRPYLRPTLDANKERIRQILISGITK